MPETTPDPRLYTDHAECPWCKYQHESAWDWQEGEQNCRRCGELFLMERQVSVSYDTYPAVHCPCCLYPVAVRNGVMVKHQNYRQDCQCEGSNQPPPA